jgi:hypothetical protein
MQWEVALHCSAVRPELVMSYLVQGCSVNHPNASVLCQSGLDANNNISQLASEASPLLTRANGVKQNKNGSSLFSPNHHPLF